MNRLDALKAAMLNAEVEVENAGDFDDMDERWTRWVYAIKEYHDAVAEAGAVHRTTGNYA